MTTSSAAKDGTRRAADGDQVDGGPVDRGPVDRGPVDTGRVERAVVQWLRNDLGDQELTAEENFLDVGGHSLTFSRLNVFLGANFGLRLDQKITYDDSLRAAVAGARPVDVGGPDGNTVE